MDNKYLEGQRKERREEKTAEEEDNGEVKNISVAALRGTAQKHRIPGCTGHGRPWHDKQRPER